ncbi:C-type MBL-2 protein precursor [Aphelenchoides avenae]|nr:C-type MBL-2 protein precursor [Aphelenchus avenae]
MIGRVSALLLAVVGLVAGDMCPPGASPGPEGKRCLRPSTIDQRTGYWWFAEADCVRRGGHLASVSSAAENDFIRGLFMSESPSDDNVADYWLGAVERERESEAWSWADGSNFAYTNWADGQPNFNYDEHLTLKVAVNVSTGKWFTEAYVPKFYVCEVPPIASP